jgi:hypothetical protein
MLIMKKFSRSMLAFSVLLVFCLAVSACGAQQPTEEIPDAAPVLTEEVLATDAELVLEPPAESGETEVPAQEPVEQTAVNEPVETEGYPAPGYQFPTPTTDGGPYPSPEQGGAPAVKTGLEATDPAAVVLASGKPQLVEFFAFW